METSETSISTDQPDLSVLNNLKEELSKKIVGQTDLLEKLLIAILCEGHVLLEGMPGLAKTLVIKSLAQALHLDFQRIQFTPDLLPADIIGTLIYDPQKMDFSVKKGPVFSHFILADEINRAPAKVQSALLEAMEERQVSIGEETFALPHPFLVMATQNPVDHDGTFPLPQAQMDRFMFKIDLNYPEPEEEEKIISLNLSKSFGAPINTVAKWSELAALQDQIDAVFIDPKISKYVVGLVNGTRFPDDELKPYLEVGVSPRAGIQLTKAARAQAFLQGRDFVIPEDVQHLCKDVFRHRIIPTYLAEAEKISPDSLIDSLLKKVHID